MIGNNPGKKDNKNLNEETNQIVKFIKKIIDTNPLIVIFEFANAFSFVISTLRENFNIFLIVIFSSLVISFILYLLRNLIYSYINNKNKNLNPHKIKEWIKDLAIVQTMFFIILICLYFIIVYKSFPERYYQEMDSIFGPVIETKVATISPTYSVTPIIEATLTPTITSSPTITPTSTYTPEPKEYQVKVFIDEMFQNLDRYLNDKNKEEEVDIPQYFCDDEGKAVKNFSNNFVNRIFSNYANGNSTFEIDCDTEIDPSRMYDRGTYWYVEFENKCDIACSMAIYNDVEYLIGIDLLKPTEYRDDFCIHDFNLILSKN